MAVCPREINAITVCRPGVLVGLIAAKIGGGPHTIVVGLREQDGLGWRGEVGSGAEAIGVRGLEIPVGSPRTGVDGIGYTISPNSFIGAGTELNLLALEVGVGEDSEVWKRMRAYPIG